MVPFFIGDMNFKFYIITNSHGAIWSGSRYRHWSKSGTPVTYRSISGVKQGLRSYRMQRDILHTSQTLTVIEMTQSGQRSLPARLVLKACRTCGHVPSE